MMPPGGTGLHITEDHFDCAGGWTSQIISITENFSPANCEALSSQTLQSPSCFVGSAMESTSCSATCSELWLVGLERCSANLPSFEGASGSAMSTACRQAAAAVVATSPSRVTVSGLQWHERANAEYILSPVPWNGRPQFISADGLHRICWVPTSASGSQAVWQINGVDAELDSPADELPFGSAVWQELNTDANVYSNSRILLRPAYDEGWCAASIAALSPVITYVCCRDEDGPTCGSEVAPNICTADCAHLWRPFQEQCPTFSSASGLADQGLSPELVLFFGEWAFPIAIFKTVCLPLDHSGNPGVNTVSHRVGKLETPGPGGQCVAAGASLDVLPPATATLSALGEHDFFFQAVSGRRRCTTQWIARVDLVHQSRPT